MFSAPLSRNDFRVAIICALPVEYDAVALVFDKLRDHEGDKYRRVVGDYSHLNPYVSRFFAVMVINMSFQYETPPTTV